MKLLSAGVANNKILLFLVMMVTMPLIRSLSFHGWRHTQRSTRFAWISSPLLFSSSSSSSSSSFDKARFVQKQKDVSDSHSASSGISSSGEILKSEKEFLKLQKEIFDDSATFFASTEAITDDLIPIYVYMTKQILESVKQQRKENLKQIIERNITQPSDILLSNNYRILDVGCGTGALFPFYLQIANELDMTLNITGIDLSSNMVQLANQHANELLVKERQNNKLHNIQVIESDVLQYDDGQGLLYDGIVANACFANFYNPYNILAHFCDKLLAINNLSSRNGLLFVTHPLGNEFVKQLHEKSPESVPHLLPTREEFDNIIKYLPLQLDKMQENIQLNENENETVHPYYFLSSKRVRHTLLEQIIRLRGEVDTGYGRGGKKLGFPTANLPSSKFQDALQDIQTGVYFGYALLEDNEKDNKKKGRNVIHKAVVNVGYSPTFEGKENIEKIVEAHLIFDNDEGQENTTPLDPTDFYGETMRLQLHGFLRPEIKFPNFPSLVTQIKTDVLDAKEILDTISIYNSLRNDDFFKIGINEKEEDEQNNDSCDNIWIGSTGGNEKASWEFDSMDNVLSNISHK